MKKILLTLITTLLLVNITYSQQGIFYLAKYLREQYSDDTKTIPFDAPVKAALEKNVYKNINVDTAILNNNPFFINLFEPAPGSGIAAFLSPVMKSIGGLNVTKYANAIADIMIERAKQELTVAFFDRFKKFANNNREFQILFPKTTDNLSNLLSYTYPQMLPALRDGFFEDLKQTTYRLDDVLELPRYQSLLKNFPEVRIAIKSLRLVHELETGASNAADIIKEFTSFKEWDNAASSNKIKSAGSCLKIAAFFSESIRNDETISNDKVWVGAEELKQLFYDDVFFNIYMGLLYQQATILQVEYIDGNGASKDLSKILEEQKDNLFLFQNKLKEFFDLTGNVNTAFKDLQSKIVNNENPSNEDIYNYINTSINILDYSFSIVTVFKENPVATEYITLAKSSNNLYRSIYTKHYSEAINNIVDIFIQLNKLINEQIDFQSLQNNATIKGYSGIAKEDVSKLIKEDKIINQVKMKSLDNVSDNATAGIPAMEQLVEHYRLKKLSDFIEKVKPYALFMANMVEAKDDKEVKAALENVILPVGSSSVKKITSLNISVQSYLGVYLSFANKNEVNSSWSDKFGVIAPIGISVTPGFLSWGKGGSLSPFISLFDLGAIVDYKLQKEPDVNSTDPNATVIMKDYEVKLGQIFSPGAYLVYGFPWRLPVSLGVGVQYGPGLSKIDSDNNTVINNPSWRGNFFFAVDIPFFNLKNKVKNQ